MIKFRQKYPILGRDRFLEKVIISLCYAYRGLTDADKIINLFGQVSFLKNK